MTTQPSTDPHEQGYYAAVSRLNQEIAATADAPHARAQQERAEKLKMLISARDMIAEQEGSWAEREEYAKLLIVTLRTLYNW